MSETPRANHLERGHTITHRGDFDECSCGATFWDAAPVQPSAPPEGLSARLRDGNESCSKFVRGGSGVAPDFYCARCQATVYEHLQREAADALDAALAREREQTAEIARLTAERDQLRETVANVGDAIAEYCALNGDEGVPADQAEAVRFIGQEVSTLREELAEAKRLQEW